MKGYVRGITHPDTFYRMFSDGFNVMIYHSDCGMFLQWNAASEWSVGRYGSYICCWKIKTVKVSTNAVPLT